MELDEERSKCGAFSHDIGFNNLARFLGEHFNSLMD